MHTASLYDTDPYLQEVNARVISSERDGSGYRVTLDQTIFYPGGGGQLPDSGWINTEPVERIGAEAGKVDYFIRNSVADDVLLKLDWNLRYKNMQQHTGQHVLSAAFEKVVNLPTVSVHLGHADTLIELQAEQVSDDQLIRAESEANRVIREAVEVKTLICPKNDLEKMKLRRDIKVDSDPVRLVSIGDYDLTGCGGTHVRSTSEVGLIKIISTEKIRNRIRIAARIGRPAYEYFDILHVQGRYLGREMSCAVEDLSDRYGQVVEEVRQQKRDMRKLKINWLTEYAQRLEPKKRIGYFIVSDLEPGDLQVLGQAWIHIHNLPCLIVATGGNRFNFNLQVPENSEFPAGPFIEQNRAGLSMQGGGNPLQASGILNVSELSSEFLDLVESRLREYFKCEESHK